MEPRKTVWQSAACAFSALAPVTYLARSLSAVSLLEIWWKDLWSSCPFWFLFCIPALFFTISHSWSYFYDAPSDSKLAFLAFLRLHNFDRSEWFCVGWSSYSCAERVVAEIDAFTTMEQKRNTAGISCRWRIFQKLTVVWFRTGTFIIVTLCQGLTISAKMFRHLMRIILMRALLLLFAMSMCTVRPTVVLRAYMRRTSRLIMPSWRNI